MDFSLQIKSWGLNMKIRTRYRLKIECQNCQDEELGHIQIHTYLQINVTQPVSDTFVPYYLSLMRFLSLFHWLCLQRQVWWQRQNETNSRILLTLLLMDDGVKVCPRYPTFEQCFYLFKSVAKIHCNLDFWDHSKAVLRHHFLLQNSRYGGSAPMGLATQASMLVDCITIQTLFSY